MEMNGKGFKFGSKTTQQSTCLKSISEFIIVFNHKSKNFDNNNSEKYTGYITICASFNNNINQQLPYTFSKWTNNWSWTPKKAHQNIQIQSFKTPKDITSATKADYNVRDKICNCRVNKFSDNSNFDNIIKGQV